MILFTKKLGNKEKIQLLIKEYQELATWLVHHIEKLESNSKKPRKKTEELICAKALLNDTFGYVEFAIKNNIDQKNDALKSSIQKIKEFINN